MFRHNELVQSMVVFKRNGQSNGSVYCMGQCNQMVVFKCKGQYNNGSV